MNNNIQGVENGCEQRNEDADNIQNERNWEMNYLEASIFLEEGENNDKFDSHPKDHSALPAYLIAHNHWFYTLDLCASLLLMFLAIMEPPSIEAFKDIPVGVHSSVELFGLAILGISIAMQVRWLGWKTFLKHRRSLVKSVTWLIMVAESLAVLARNTTHFRVTRSLRPIFLVDSRYLGGVRRLLRQILQSLPPILEVLGLLLFTLIIFAVFGFYLFSSNKEDPYFTNLYLSFVSLYVLLTTANYPDVMMPSYAENRWSALFYIAYLAITLYFIMNLMLAIVFVEFSNIEKDKFRKLLLHKREACQHAFQLLLTHSQPNRITFKHFQGLMHFYKPKHSRRSVYLLFKALNHSRTGCLSMKEFYGIYDTLEFRWSLAKETQPWFVHLWGPLQQVCFLIRRMVKWKGFQIVVYCVIVSSASILLIHTIMLSEGLQDGKNLRITYDQMVCITLFVIEVILKLIGLGPGEYLSCGWNVLDFTLTLLSVGGVVAQYFDAAFFFIVILRPLRLLRLFRVRKRYRDIFQTLSILLPRILSTIIVIFIIYYFFAIVGMELFSSADLENCCVNTTVEQYYRMDNTSFFHNYYYLNNFNTLLISGVTLFELTVVNNWFIIMEGYAWKCGEWSRLYFMVFYLVMMVVLSIVVAFVIEAFTFRMRCNEAFKDDGKEPEGIKMNIVVTKEELDFMYCDDKSVSGMQAYASSLNGSGDVRYVGLRRRTKFVLQRRIYSELITSWLREHREASVDSYQVLRGRAASSQSSANNPPSSPLRHNSFNSFDRSNDSVTLEQIVQTLGPVSTADDDPLIEVDDPFFPSNIRA